MCQEVAGVYRGQRMHVKQCDEASALCKTCAAENLRGSRDLLLTSRGAGEGGAAGERLGRVLPWRRPPGKSCRLQSVWLD